MTALTPLPAPTDTADGLSANTWGATVAILFGTIMVVLDTTIVNVALPKIGADLQVGHGIEWIVTAYLLGVVISLPISGWLADTYGKTRVYRWMLGAFSATSLLVALSPNLGVAATARFLQGLAGGGLLPVGMAILLSVFPKHRHGTAIAIWGGVAMVAPAIGPTAGGYVVTHLSWNWLFTINAPLGVIALVVCQRLLVPHPPDGARQFDLTGCMTGSGGLALVVLGLSQAPPWGWTSANTIGSLAAGTVLLAVFVRHESRTPAPLLDLRMFSYRSFRTTSLIGLLMAAASYSRLVFIPLALETLRGLSPFEVGLLLAPAAAGLGCGLTVGGRLTDKVGVRLPVLSGCGIAFVGFFSLSHIALSTPLWFLTLTIAVQGAGAGLTISPSIVGGLGDLPKNRISQASAARSICQQVGGLLGVAGLTALLSARSGSHPSPAQAQVAFNSLYYVACGLVAACAVLALGLDPSVQVSPDAIADDSAFALGLAD